MKRRFNYRAYPDEAVQARARRTFGCVRVAQNLYLAERRRLHALGLHNLVEFGTTAKQVTTLAKRTPEYGFLAEVSAVALQQGVADVRTAYKNWFDSRSGKRKGRRMNPPAFKRKTSRQAARFSRAAKFKVLPTPGSRWGKVNIPGIGLIRFLKSRDLPSDPSSVTLISNPDGTWEVSFVVETQPMTEPTCLTSRIVSIDAGLKHLASATYIDPKTGETSREKIDNPRHLKAALRKLRRQQRAMDRREKGSTNREKARLQVAKTHAGVAAKRKDHHLKLAARLARENAVIVREDLCLYGMGRTRLSKSVYDTALGTLFAYLDDAAKTHGRTIKVIGRWEPTTQTCSVCGTPGGKKPLSVREWTCEGCGVLLDRDYNAAVNILVAGGLSETLNACGPDVRRTLACAVGDEAGTHRTTTVVAAPAA